jgi:hypothetical protein
LHASVLALSIGTRIGNPIGKRSNGPIAAARYGTVGAEQDHVPNDKWRRWTGETLMGSMEEFIHSEKLSIFKRRLADPTITNEQRQMLTRLLAAEQAQDISETKDAVGGLGGPSGSAL